MKNNKMKRNMENNDTLVDQIEDQIDYEIGEKALEELENEKNPVMYSIEEVAAELGIKQ